MYAMRKIYLPDNSWLSEVQSIFNDSNEKFEFELKHNPKSTEKIPWWKKFSLKRESAVGGPAIEGLIPLLEQGIDVFLELRDSYLYIALEIWALYEFLQQKSLKTKVLLQTITDYIVGEDGETLSDQKSITFIWPPDLTKEQFESLVEKMSETRKSVYKILLKLDGDTTKQINHISCKVKDGEWKINIVNKQKRVQSNSSKC
jgi:hypothetical protein